MRALMMTDVTARGGVDAHMRQLVHIAQERGWHVSVLMDDGQGSDWIADTFRRQDVLVHRGPLYHGYHSDAKISGFTRTVLQREDPLLVHAQCGSPRSVLVPRETALDARLPVIVTENYVSRSDIDTRTLGRIREVYFRSFAIISVCLENQTLLREHFGLTAPVHEVIPYGVPLRPPRRWPTENGRFRILCVARLTNQKGIDRLIRAVALMSAGARGRIEVVVAGEGNERNTLIALAAELGVADRIKFIGWSQTVPELLAESDLFVLPSRSEGMPIALLEALAAGLPCIASAVSGIPEALGYGAYGSLVPDGEPTALAAAIQSFCDDPLTLRRKAAVSRVHLAREHDPQTNAGRVLALWGAASTTPAGRQP